MPPLPAAMRGLLTRRAGICSAWMRFTRQPQPTSSPPSPFHLSPPSYSITVFAAASRGLEVTGSNQLTGVRPPRFFLPLTNCHILPLSLAAKTLFILPLQVRPSAERSITVYMVPCRLRLLPSLIRLLMFCFQPAAFRGRDAPRVGRSQARISRANLHLPAVLTCGAAGWSGLAVGSSTAWTLFFGYAVLFDSCRVVCGGGNAFLWRLCYCLGD
jgi:hypothetical protein